MNASRMDKMVTRNVVMVRKSQRARLNIQMKVVGGHSRKKFKFRIRLMDRELFSAPSFFPETSLLSFFGSKWMQPRGPIDISSSISASQKLNEWMISAWKILKACVYVRTLTANLKRVCSGFENEAQARAMTTQSQSQLILIDVCQWEESNWLILLLDWRA